MTAKTWEAIPLADPEELCKFYRKLVAHDIVPVLIGGMAINYGFAPMPTGDTDFLLLVSESKVLEKVLASIEMEREYRFEKRASLR